MPTNARRGPKPGGRPTAYSPELAAEICLHRAHNISLVSWCKGRDLREPDPPRNRSGGTPGKAQMRVHLAEIVRQREERAKTRPGYTTVQDWLRQHEDFAQKYQRAELDRGDFTADEILEIADDPSIPSDQKKLMMDGRKWIAERMNRRKYGATEPIKAEMPLDDDQRLSELNALLEKGAGIDGPVKKILDRLQVLTEPAKPKPGAKA